MKAWVLHGPRDLRMENRPSPSASPGSVVIRVTRAGICGSDMHYYAEGRAGAFVMKMPFVLGHEFAGEIVEKGNGVTGLDRGDRVAVEPAIPCRTCGLCRRGRYNLCASIRMFGSASAIPHLDGGFQEYVQAPASSCHKLPGSVNDEIGALLEPLAVATHAIARSGGVAGQRVQDTGAGTIGHCVLEIARALGAPRIVVSDPDPFTRRFALEHGADGAVDPLAADAEARLMQHVPEGFDVVFEASGSPRALEQAIRVCARGASIVQVGTLPLECSLPAGLVLSKEIALLGSFRYVNAFEKVLDLLAGERISVRHIVTNVLPLDDLQTAMETAAGAGDVLKVQVRM